jgi:hypothetical protein
MYIEVNLGRLDPSVHERPDGPHSRFGVELMSGIEGGRGTLGLAFSHYLLKAGRGLYFYKRYGTNQGIFFYLEAIMLKAITIKSNNLLEKSFVISIRSNNDFLMAKAISNKSDNVSSQYYSAMR